MLARLNVEQAVVLKIEHVRKEEVVTTGVLPPPLFVFLSLVRTYSHEQREFCIVHSRLDDGAEMGSTWVKKKRNTFFGYLCTTSPFEFFFSISVML